MKPLKIKTTSLTVHKCALCSYSTTFLQRYTNHLAVHSSKKPWKCLECPYKAKMKGTVTQHVKNVHLLRSGSGVSRSFPCPHSGCNYVAKRNSTIKIHLKIHLDVKSLLCAHPSCNYSTNDKKCLVIHTRTHTGEKPYKCQFESCSFASATRHELVEHSRTHTKERPYKCPQPNCEYSAAQKSSVKMHQLTHKPKEGEERPSFPCSICEFTSKHKRHLSRHITQSHTLEKLFKCDEPGCTFEASRKENVENHKAVHSDEKRFACSFESCDFRCKSKTSLSSHLKSHSEERRYKCELCPYRGKTRQAVQSHLKNVHFNLRPFKCTEPHCDYASKFKAHRNQHLLTHKRDEK